MLILFPKPKEITGYHILAVNLQRCDEISMSKDKETNLFHLTLIKTFDGHQSNQSAYFYTIGIFETQDNCLTLWQNLLDALNSDQKTFEIPESPRCFKFRSEDLRDS